MIAPGDILITLRTCGDLQRGDVVTVSHTSPSGEYVYLDETSGKIASRADAFMLAVRRPWHAWADPEWEAKAREAAERFVKEGLAVESQGGPDLDGTTPCACHPPVAVSRRYGWEVVGEAIHTPANCFHVSLFAGTAGERWMLNHAGEFAFVAEKETSR